MLSFRELLFMLSIFSATTSALVGIAFPYPYPELIAATFLLMSTSGPAFLAVTAITILILVPIVDEYFLYSAYLIIAVVKPLTALESIKRFFTRPKFRSLAIAVILLNLVAMFIQYFFPQAWPDIAYVTLGEGQRAAGLKQEPSHTIILLVIAATLAFTSRPDQSYKAAALFNTFALLLLFLTKSDLVALVWASYFALAVSRRTPKPVMAIALGLAVYLGFRSIYALNELLFQEMGSWRSVPDFAIILKPESFLWPNISDIQFKLNGIIEEIFAGPSFVEWTYSIFSTSVLTIGLIPMLIIFVLGYRYWNASFHKIVSFRAVPVVFVAMLFLPKYESAAIILLAGAHYLFRIEPDGKGLAKSAQLAGRRQPYLSRR